MDITKYFAGGFPLTIERLQFMQNAQNKAISQLTRLAGTGKLIIEGVEVSGGNVSSGVIIIDGEIIAFEGGTLDARVAVFETKDDVPYNEDVDQDGNLDQKVADVVRVARCAASGGIESFDFDDLVRVPNLKSLNPMVGEIKQGIFDINNLPSGWFLCDGTNGTPDLRGRTMIGAGAYDTGNNQSVNYPLESEGGAHVVGLNQNNLPNVNVTGSTNSGGSHNHNFRNFYYIESYVNPNANLSGFGTETIGSGLRGSGDSDGDNRYAFYKDDTTLSGGSHTHSISVSLGGQNVAHENMMPYFAVNTIIYLG